MQTLKSTARNLFWLNPEDKTKKPIPVAEIVLWIGDAANKGSSTSDYKQNFAVGVDGVSNLIDYLTEVLSDLVEMEKFGLAVKPTKKNSKV